MVVEAIITTEGDIDVIWSINFGVLDLDFINPPSAESFVNDPCFGGSVRKISTFESVKFIRTAMLK